jgi:antitoxin MazE
MRTQLHRLGNSQAVVIPKPLLAQLGIERQVELELVGDHLEVRRVSAHPRAGWAQAVSLLPADALVPTDEEREWLDMPGPEISE